MQPLERWNSTSITSTSSKTYLLLTIKRQNLNAMTLTSCHKLRWSFYGPKTASNSRCPMRPRDRLGTGTWTVGSLVPYSPKRAWRLFWVLEMASNGTKRRIRREARAVPSIWTSHQVPRFLIPDMKREPSKPHACGSQSILSGQQFTDIPGLNITEYSRRQDIYCKKSLSIATGAVCFIGAQILLRQKGEQTK